MKKFVFLPDHLYISKNFENGIEKLEKHWTDCITFEGDYVDE